MGINTTEQFGSRIEPRTTVVGVGGAGCNIVNQLYSDLPSVRTVAVGTDMKAMDRMKADSKLLIYLSSDGSSAPADAETCRKCAVAHKADIENKIANSEIVFVIAGMGGNTGSGAAPAIAEIARGHGCIVVGLAVNPFGFETGRLDKAAESASRFKAACTLWSSVDNAKVQSMMPNATVEEAFRTINRGIASYVTSMQSRIASTFLAEYTPIVMQYVDAKLDGSRTSISVPSTGTASATISRFANPC